ncbi:MAG: DNA repair protein RecO [Fimbriimonadaceae bacterium]
MATDRTVRAIVLRRQDAGESDRRLTLFTVEYGKLDAVAKGARKGGSRLAGISEPLSVSDMTLAEGRRTRYVTQVLPVASFPGLRNDFDRLTYGLALTEFAAAVLPWESPLPDTFEVLTCGLHGLESHAQPLAALCWALVKLLEVSGFLPQFDVCVETGASIQEAFGSLSASAGGYVVEAHAARFQDCYRVQAEVLVALARLAELAEPPPRLKLDSACFMALYPLCRAVADAPLSALTVVRDGLRAG